MNTKNLFRVMFVVLVAISGSAGPARAHTSKLHYYYLPMVSGPRMRVLWTDTCDPRTDPNFCHLSNSLTIWHEFYATLDDVGATLEYTMPQTLAQLRQYDVVIAQYCSAVYVLQKTPLLSQYVLQGGSTLVLGDNFCIVGADNQGNVSAARAATALTASRGISFTQDDAINVQFSNQILPHPTTTNVGVIYSYRHAYLQVSVPATTVVTMAAKPFIAVYDAVGTIVAVPDTGFYWGNSFQQVGQSDNFVFWRNALRWLAMKSRMKQPH